MDRPRTLAAAQSVPVRGDVDANVEQHLLLVNDAAQQDVEVLVFPELSLTGYELDLATELAFSRDDARLRPLIDAAEEHAIKLVVGAPLRLGSALHIGAFIIDPGRAVDVYTKRYLGSGEESFVRAGSLDPLIQVAGDPAAIAVCADTNRPSHPKQAAERGAKTYLVSSFIGPDQLEDRARGMREYAMEYSMTVVLANYGGPSGGLEAAGSSTIWSAQGEILAQAGAVGVDLAVARPVDSP